MSPEHPDTRARDAARTAVAALLVLGALAYTTWALEAFLPTGLSPLRSYVSELAAEDQPYGTFFRSLDFAAGVLVCAGAVLALLRPARTAGLPRGLALLSTLGWVGVAVFGAATAADSRLPLSCAPTADAACAARERAGLVPTAHSAHAVSSSVAVAGALVGMVLLTVVVRRAGARGDVRTGGLLAVLLGVELAATVWTLAAVAAFDAGHGTWGLGVAQRLQLLTIAVWLVVVAWPVRRSGPRE
ncbi:DUF998 domain-containing protein [Streptomyces flavofungini]|uniref:DUF998 domain-containing protein n=1 Tax=Streptomyces flavofungini TaxID=68200 RepID=UPI0025B2377C|nr:DUF998 domain-containing protein [Streptomyces flavofungini]WJV49161.1 DUF998 domain-containing protein [Streptomyces flavofungini]